MNFEQTVAYLYSLLPDFQRIGKDAYKSGWANMQRLSAYLGEPHGAFRSIHVAGTNGKGSVACMVAAVLQSAGYKAGLYTSPHLTSFCERIKVNGNEISQQAVVDFTAHCHSIIEEVRPSFFELTTAMAFHYFAQQKVDFAVVETGLGGRLDSTNIIAPIVSVITHIALDHCDLLGDTLEKIATEKAGIIKPKTPAVIGTRQDETCAVFEQKAQQCYSPLLFADQHYHVLQSNVDEDLQHFDIQKNDAPTQHFATDLLGNYQRKNICTALATLDLLQEHDVQISPKEVDTGFRNVLKITNLQGRWQTLQTLPTVVCDIAHNADGLSQTLAQIEQYDYRQLHIVFGIAADKDLDAILPLLPRKAYYYFTQAQSPRALPSNELAEKCRRSGLQGEVTFCVQSAVAQAKRNATPTDFIYIGGSAFVVAEILND